jgi:hypothetical protein
MSLPGNFSKADVLDGKMYAVLAYLCYLLYCPFDPQKE